jgi:hypothetical protein
MTRLRSLRVLVLALAPIALLLAFASGAAAETWSGESTTIEFQVGNPSPEVTLVTASASYDPTAGNVSVDIVTGAEPLAEESNQGFAEAALMRVPGACNYGTVHGYLEGGAPLGTSPFLLVSPYSQPFFGLGILDRQPELVEVPITKAVSGSATALSAGSSLLANQGYNCAYIYAQNGTGLTIMVFPLVLQLSEPPAPAAPAPPAPAAIPAPAPPALTIAKAKPFKLKAGKARSVKIKVTNTGATASAQGSLKVKSTKGILVTPEVQKLPPLAPGASWSVYVRLKPTEKAKATATLPLTAAASGITGKGSLAVKVEQ